MAGQPPSILANLKNRLAESVKNLAGPLDPAEKRVYDLVERATSDQVCLLLGAARCAPADGGVCFFKPSSKHTTNTPKR